MAFNSFLFWIVFPFIFLIYWVIPSRLNKTRNLFLLLVSYALYLNWKPVFALTLLGVTAITYIGGLLIDKTDRNKRKKTICWIFAILALLPLCVFKYYNFINDTLTNSLEQFGLHFELPGLNWAIPIGISFFTFQAVGYTLDVYHKRITAEKDFMTYALFVSFFPQITSGPISTAKDLMPQFKTPHRFNYEQGLEGLKMILWGLFLKLALADRIGIYVDIIYSNYIHFSGSVCFLASILYFIHLYCDFAGYSLMAIGIAKNLGFNLINNFERPFFAASVTEFWKRWHISLTQWLTTHIYINLGGNRCSKSRQYLNIFVTFLVSGLWHGANWTYVMWGTTQGLFLTIEKFFAGEKLKAELKHPKYKLTAIRIFRVILTFNIVSLSVIFFRMPTLTDAMSFITNIISNFGTFSMSPLNNITLVSILVGLPLLFIKDVYDEARTLTNFHIKYRVIEWGFYIFIFCFTLSMGALDCGQFIYINF